MKDRYPGDKAEALELEQAVTEQSESRDLANKVKAEVKHDAELSKIGKRIRTLAHNASVDDKEFAAIVNDLYEKSSARYSDRDNRYDFGIIMHRAIIGA